MPPVVIAQERDKAVRRLPAALDFVARHRLNEIFGGEMQRLGIVCRGGLYNTMLRALARYSLADFEGRSSIPIYCLNVTYPLVDDEVAAFCEGKERVLIVEEGNPDFIEQAVHVVLRRRGLSGNGPR